MSFSVGIVGLPNVGKSTLFKLLTKKSVEIGNYPFTTLSPNIGLAPLSDERLKRISEIVKPEKVTFPTIKFIDIAGLVKEAHKGEGLGNQFLAQIRICDALLIVLRGFEKENVENVLGEINPQKEIEILKLELIMKDIETVRNAISKLEKKKEMKERIELLKKIEGEILKEKLISQLSLSEEEIREIKEYQFLTQKPYLYLLNTNKKELPFEKEHLKINLKEEEEISELSKEEIKELGLNSNLEKVIKACYNLLSLITFYTIAGGRESKGWVLKNGSKILEAGRMVHSDFEKKFIRAEVLNWRDLIEARGWINAKKMGKVKIVGKDYEVKDGDIIEFKI